MKIWKYFNETDRWDMATYYEIYEENGKKWIKLTDSFDKGDRGKDYLSWLYIKYSDKCVLSFDKAFRFGIDYQLSKMLEERCEDEGYEYGRYGRKNYYDDEMEPEDCFNLANQIVSNDGNGTIELRIAKITPDTPCGKYVDLL